MEKINLKFKRKLEEINSKLKLLKHNIRDQIETFKT
jgi:hypothetical protein